MARVSLFFVLDVGESSLSGVGTGRQVIECLCDDVGIVCVAGGGTVVAAGGE